VKEWKKLIGKSVEITWEDPETTAGWAHNRTISAKLPAIQTYGVLLKVGKKKVVACGTISRKCKMACDIFKWPVGCIVSIREVK
jgi:hypothetical protein